jgi:hypothetical protein
METAGRFKNNFALKPSPLRELAGVEEFEDCELIEPFYKSQRGRRSRRMLTLLEHHGSRTLRCVKLFYQKLAPRLRGG